MNSFKQLYMEERESLVAAAVNAHFASTGIDAMVNDEVITVDNVRKTLEHLRRSTAALENVYNRMNGDQPVK